MHRMRGFKRGLNLNQVFLDGTPAMYLFVSLIMTRRGTVNQQQLVQCFDKLTLFEFESSDISVGDSIQYYVFIILLRYDVPYFQIFTLVYILNSNPL